MRGAGTTQSQIGKSCRATFPPAFFADHILQLREHAARARNLNSAFLALTPARRASKGSSFFRDRREISSKIRVGLPESNAISWGAFVPLYSEYDAPPLGYRTSAGGYSVGPGAGSAGHVGSEISHGTQPAGTAEIGQCRRRDHLAGRCLDSDQPHGGRKIRYLLETAARSLKSSLMSVSPISDRSTKWRICWPAWVTSSANSSTDGSRSERSGSLTADFADDRRLNPRIKASR